MKTQNIEEKMIRMSKPDVTRLKHEEILRIAITNTKDKLVVSWWWLSIPIYIIAMFLMKSIYMPGTSLIFSIHELSGKDKFSFALFFLILPVVFIIINFINIRKIYFLAGSPKIIDFLLTVWLNVLIIVFSIIILIIYSL